MKKRISSLLLHLLPLTLAGVLSFGLSSCSDRCTNTITYNSVVPIYTPISELRAVEIRVSEAQGLQQAGKIYVYDDFLFINEIGKGIHIVDNSNPSSPQFINYINIPGNVDMAVNNGVLYADSYVDLLAFDISDPRNIQWLKRVKDVFPSVYYHEAKGILMTYKDTVYTLIEHNDCRVDPVVYYEDLSTVGGPVLSGASGKTTYGKAGSMARFALMDDYLYAVTQNDLRLFDVTNAADPHFVKNISIGWGIETIFPYKNRLFIGSQNGMHIYDATHPETPAQLSVYEHMVSCDPVVVNDDYAFVTLRSGNFCQQGFNRLDVVKLADINNPELLKSYDMQNPHGLSLNGDFLFLCEGDFGIKSFDVSNVLKIGSSQLQHLKNVKAFDIIAAKKSLIVTGAQGIYQYDYSNPSDLKELSHIPVNTDTEGEAM